MNPETPPVLVERRDAITTLTLNRPDKRNALNIALLETLCAAIGDADADRSQRVLILRGAGPVFCSGLDLAEAAQPGTAQASAELIGRTLELLSCSHLISLAAVHGAALAGGAGLMSACDFALATRDSKFGYPEVRRGLVPALIMTFLRRQLRERDVRELLLGAKLFDADHARAIGLLNRVVADDAELTRETYGLAESILQGAPEAVAHTKKLLAELWHAPIETDLERALTSHLHARDSAEAKEGVAAFLEKRAPKWAPK